MMMMITVPVLLFILEYLFSVKNLNFEVAAGAIDSFDLKNIGHDAHRGDCNGSIGRVK
jgi:hypothetical protein